VPRSEWLALFTSRRHLTQFFADILLLAMAMLADGWILVRLAREVGVYLALALEGVVALAAVIVVGSAIHHQLQLLHRSARSGDFRPKQYGLLAAYIVAGVLLVLPGFATDVLGALIYLPPGRNVFVALFLRKNRERIPVVYEYFKMSVYSDGSESKADGR
jgi:UPF0716 protein FxsA